MMMKMMNECHMTVVQMYIDSIDSCIVMHHCKRSRPHLFESSCKLFPVLRFESVHVLCILLSSLDPALDATC